MSILKVGVLAVAGVLLAVQFKNGKTEYSTYISVVLGILIFGGILGYLEILIHAFDKLEEDRLCICRNFIENAWNYLCVGTCVCNL
jgi:stage III sporulation protein AD